MAPGNDAAWTALLDAFERTLDDGAEPEPFTTPPGPPPAHLVARAFEVLERQRREIDAVTRTRAEIARELTAIKRIPSTQSSAPVYLDVSG